LCLVRFEDEEMVGEALYTAAGAVFAGNPCPLDKKGHHSVIRAGRPRTGRDRQCA